MNAEELVVYDKAKWHYEGEYPRDLPESQAYVIPGMFLAWAAGQGLLAKDWREDFEEDLARLRTREITAGRALAIAGGTLASDMLSETGNGFAAAYYQSDEYYADAFAVLGTGLPSLYHAADTWESFDKLKRVLDRRFEEWRKT